MRILGYGKETFLFLNGVGTNRVIRLGKNVELLPAKCSPYPDLIIKLSKREIDIGVACIFLRGVSSQIRIVANTPKRLAVQAWNSLWDAILLSALLHCEAICNFQCDAPAEKLGPTNQLHVTNYYLRGLSSSKPRIISEKEAVWIEENFQKAKTLLDNPMFENAVHALASYKWHAHSRARLAILWSGIEGIFRINSELAFRISLYVARFLEPKNSAKRIKIFNKVKQLYKCRSQAVHGATLKSGAEDCVEESAQLLMKLVRQCVVCNSLPSLEQLAP